MTSPITEDDSLHLLATFPRQHKEDEAESRKPSAAEAYQERFFARGRRPKDVLSSETPDE